MATSSNTASSFADYSGQGNATAAVYVDRLTRFGRRLRLLAVLLRGARALWLAALLYVTLSLIGSLLAPQYPIFTVSLLLAFGVFLLLLVPTFLRRRSTLDVARAYDARLALSERLASAVEVLGHTPNNPFRAVLLDDAWRHADGIEPRRAFPLRIPQRDLLLLFVALSALFFWEVFPYMAGRLAPLAPLAHQVAAVREGTLIERTTPDELVVGEQEISPEGGQGPCRAVGGGRPRATRTESTVAHPG